MKTKKATVMSLLLIMSMTTFAGPQDDLWKACMQCDLDAVKKSVAAGADVKAMHSSKQNALALSYFCPNVTAYLIEQGVDPMSDGGGALVGAANNYSMEVVKLLLDAGADPNAVSPIYGANAIDITLRQTNCVPCLKLLADHGADFKKVNPDGSTYAHTLAAFSMTGAERKSLFAQGKAGMESYGLNVPDWYGDLGPDRNGSPGEMLNILIAGGIDVNKPNNEGFPPLNIALRRYNLELSKAMIKEGADVLNNITVNLAGSKVTYVPICAAAEFADVELMQMILDKGADINATTSTNALQSLTNYRGNTSWDGDGFTPLIISIMSNKLDVAHFLVDKGADIKIGSSGVSLLTTKYDNLLCLVKTTKKTPIYWAVEKDDLTLVEKIGGKMEWHFNPDFTVKQYETGSRTIGIETVKCVSFKSKQSPSLYASQIGNQEASKLLASKGL